MKKECWSRMLVKSCRERWSEARSKAVKNAGRKLSTTLVGSRQERWSEAVNNAGRKLSTILTRSCQQRWSKAVNNAGRELSRMLRGNRQECWSEAVKNAGQKLSRMLIKCLPECRYLGQMPPEHHAEVYHHLGQLPTTNADEKPTTNIT